MISAMRLRWLMLVPTSGARESRLLALACATPFVPDASDDDAPLRTVANRDAGAYRALAERDLAPIVR
jgi:hypothetical protein